MNIIARKTDLSYKFLFENGANGLFPEFIGLIPNIYQNSDGFYENSLQLNLKVLTQKPIIDAWIIVNCDHLVIYLLVENVHPNVDLNHYSIKRVTREVVKITLTRQRIHALSKKKEVFSDPEQCIFGQAYLYNYIMQTAEKMIVLGEIVPVFIFISKTSLIIVSNFSTQIFTWNKSEYTVLQQNIGIQSVIYIPSKNDKIDTIDFNFLAQNVFFFINEKSLILHKENQLLSAFYCEESIKIFDFDFIKNLALLITQKGDVIVRFFVPKMFLPTSSPHTQVIFIELQLLENIEHLMINQKRFAIKNEKKVSSVIDSNFFYKVDQEQTNLQLKKTYKIEFLSKLFNINNFSGCNFLFSNKNNKISGFNTQKEEKVSIFPSFESKNEILEIFDKFLNEDLLLICSKTNLVIYNKLSQNQVIDISFDFKARKVKLIKNLVVVLTEDKFVEILNCTEESIVKLDPIDEFNSCFDIDTFEFDLMILYQNNTFKCFNLSESGFELTFSYTLNDFDNILFDQLSTGLVETPKTTNSVTNLSVVLPKIGKQSFFEYSTKFTFFEFQRSFYLTFLSNTGFLYFYRCYFTSLIRINLSCPNIFKQRISNLESLNVVKNNEMVLIHLESGKVVQFTKQQQREVIEIASKKNYLSIVLDKDGLVWGVNEGEIDELFSSQTIIKKEIKFEGNVKNSLTISDLTIKNSNVLETVTILHVCGKAEFILIIDSKGNILQKIQYNENQRITNITDVSSSSKDGNVVIFVGYSMCLQGSSEKQAKWQMISLEFVLEEMLKCRMTISLEQTAQEKDRTISNCFNISSVIFVCLDDKLLRIEQNKLIKIYEINMVSVRHVSINSNSVLLGDCTNHISFYFWHNEKSELIEQSSCVVDGGIRSLSFLKEQLMRVH